MRKLVFVALIALACAICASSHDAKPVEVVLFLESLCPDCKEFITNQLFPTWMLPGLSNIFDLKLVPYGNAREIQKGGSWVFTCQHGPNECQLNQIETCALNLYSFGSVFYFIHCIESSNDPLGAAEACANSYFLDWNAILQCSNSSSGNDLEHQMAVVTESLAPPHQYVPWVTVDGEHSTDAENNFLSTVCNAYTGPKPDACQSKVLVNVNEDEHMGCNSLGAGGCNNTNDLGVFNRTWTKFRFNIADCAKPCFGDGPCTAKCLSKKTGITTACGDCYGKSVACTAKYCMDKCMFDPFVDPCINCSIKNCKDPLVACTGVPASRLPPPK